MDQYRRFFLEKLDENLQRIRQELRCATQKTIPLESLNSILRTFHNIKSNAAFMRYPELESLSKSAEMICEKLAPDHALLPEMLILLKDALIRCEVLFQELKAGDSGIDIAKQLNERLVAAVRKLSEEKNAR